MSTETPETKNPYQARREAISRAISTWQQGDGSDSGHELDDATALEDCLLDEGLALMPRSTGHGKWVVEVDGQRAPIAPGSDRPVGLLDAEEAAELFLTLSAADEYAEHQPTVRPATEMEFKTALANHLFGGVA
ncbi:hypothetical protein FH608_046490 [Nonomuraea phyllanthi]|uniref:Uncharacterized protein n=1 Tax=Nonomuraea phyllanthi TaxID=2219224 RepID=A0A5C4V6H5_9ACTN|nr:hypothetical protein [Nonomuraea phyllanthi]KAB8186942.1 hypothetical protein FH608_046490 [Nonomuraea phyllanthi]